MEALKQKRSVRVRNEKAARKAMPITEARAHLRYLRISPRKVKVVLDLIRGEDLAKARAILRNVSRASSEPILKLVNSAAANAENNFGLDPNLLYVKECYSTEGPTLKRIRPVSKGRAHRILKRSSHINVVLGQRDEN